MAAPIDALASEAHFIDHLAPIWRALAPRHRGRFFVPPRLAAHAALRGIEAIPNARPRGSGPVLVASYADARALRPRPVVLVNHGAGQTYVGTNHGSYSGGAERDHVVLFVCPNAADAEANLARYPSARAVVAGSPRLDRFATSATSPVRRPTSLISATAGDRPRVVVTFHWDPRLPVPEARSALAHYAGSLGALAERCEAAGLEMVGHAHPRAAHRLRRLWRALGVPYEPDFEVVLDTAALLVVDNSSAGFEFAATGRPVLWLSAPWYRRDVEHGLRFWSGIAGQAHVSEPAELFDGVLAALADPPEVAAARAAMVREVWGVLDGRASERAAAAIGALLDGPAV